MELPYTISTLLVIASTAFAGIDSYKLNLEGPVHLTESPSPMPMPTRVEIYVTGPRMYIDKSDDPLRLVKRPAQRSLTNATEITNLVAVLRVNDNKPRITNITRRQGHTYHLLFFNDIEKTVMHFRVFEPIGSETPWCDVYPRSATGFAYFNDQIGSWLHLHVDPATNSPPRISARSTNHSNKGVAH